MPLQIRRGTNAQRQILAVPLASGELLWTTDTQQLFIGDGNTLANALTPVVGYNDENAQDAAAAIFTNGSHTDITFTYNDGSNTVDADVSLSAFTQNVDMSTFNLSGSGNITTSGTITAGAFRGDYKGSIFGDDSTVLVNAVNSSINLDGTVKGNIIPDTDLAYDIGSGSARFNDLYLSGSSIFLGDAVINSVGTAVNLPGGSTINGEPLGAATFAGTDLNVNIIGDDSSVIVNSSTGTVTGNFIGDIKGSVFGDNSTVLVNAIDNEIAGTIVGTIVTPETIFQSTTEQRIYDITALTTGNPGPTIGGRISRGTITNPVVVDQGDGLIDFQASAWDGSNYTTAAWIRLGVDNDVSISSGVVPGRILFAAYDVSGGISLNNVMVWNHQGRLGIKKNNPSAALDVNGDAIISGGLTADVTGSLFSDSSTMLIDGTDGKLMVANVNMVGETGNTPVDTGTVDSWLEVTVNGATKYIPLYD